MHPKGLTPEAEIQISAWLVLMWKLQQPQAMLGLFHTVLMENMLKLHIDRFDYMPPHLMPYYNTSAVSSGLWYERVDVIGLKMCHGSRK